MEQNLFAWVEIPVTNMPRAIAFYEAVFNVKLQHMSMGELEMALFPHTAEPRPGAPGSLVKHPEFYHPSKQGTLVYLSSAGGNLQTELSRVEASGGTIEVPKKQISPDHGYMAVFIDSEGNRIALHSNY